MVGNGGRVGAFAPAMLLDAFEIVGAAPAALHGPSCAARQHCGHVLVIEGDLALCADTDGHLPIESVGKVSLTFFDQSPRQAGKVRTHPA